MESTGSPNDYRTYQILQQDYEEGSHKAEDEACSRIKEEDGNNC